VQANEFGAMESPASRRVLVVEDNRVNQLLAARTLEKLGFEVDVVSNGVAALDAIAQSHYSVVLMDCQMPEMDGFQATREIRRRQHGGERTPVIALTTMSEDTDKKRCLAAGMDDYLHKPFDPNDLIRILDRWVPGITLERAYGV
jgi:CheY-like chemotaxis protein